MDAGRDILYWFRVRSLPEGGAPLEIRQQWLGLLLPIRQPRPVEGPESYIGTDVMDRRVLRQIADGVAVEPADALKVLRLCERADAADWWEALLARRPAVASLVFRRHEGDLLPSRMAYLLHPELESFDSAPN